MESTQLSIQGTFPSITWDPVVRRVRVLFQVNSNLVHAELDPLTLETQDIHVRGIGGAPAAYPEIYFHDGRVYWAWRDGVAPYKGWFGEINSDPENLGPVHGSRPLVFGEGRLAYIAGSSAERYPVRTKTVTTAGLGTFTRFGQGTGLSRFMGGNVVLIDEDMRSVPGITDPSFAGDTVVGTTDHAGKPTLLAFRGDKRCYIAPGQRSNNPRMCTDGHSFFITAWGSEGEGVRVWRVDPEDFTNPSTNYDRTPIQIPAFKEPKYAGYYFAHSRYGQFWPIQNSTILARDLYASADGNVLTYPPDTNAKFIQVAQRVPRLFVPGTEPDLALVRPYWDKVAAVFHHEVGDAATTRNETLKVRKMVERMGLAPRPIMSTLSEWDSVNSSFNGTADIAGCEIYFMEPAPTFAEMEQRTWDMINKVLQCQSGKIILIPQCYDRPPYDKVPGSLWRGKGAMLEAINYVCAVAAAQQPRIVGLLWFSYGRQGGTLEYPQLVPWHVRVVDSVGVPARLPIKKEEDQIMQFPSDEQNINALQRISISYVNDLKRPEGIFGVPPDGLSVAITRPDGQARIDTKSLAVWLGRYVRYFNEYDESKGHGGGRHEWAIVRVENDLRNSDEAKAHRPQ